MTTTHAGPTHDCADDYCAGRDSHGGIRMNGGHGRLIANADHTINDVREWFERSKPGQYREDYRAVLRFMRVEMGAPDARPVHRDEPQPPVVVDVDATYESERYTDSAKAFVNDVSAWEPTDGHSRPIRGHQMRVLRDDGLYRHLRFQSPDTGIAWFELVTWPGALTICGDMGSWTFRRTEDMFEFFGGKGDINPGYWQEKIAGDPDTAVAYDVELMKKAIREETADWNPVREAPRAHGRRVETVTSPLLGDDDTSPRDKVLAEFKAAVDELIEGLVDHEDTDRQSLDDFDSHGFEFVDTWEWKLRGHTHQYLWCCHAIRWGIREYRRHAEAGRG